ncbi:stage II sporulation protein R [Acetohalobium arabaticum]|uniref:Stage II sporulation protein R n=1 Tax=Acetohalobium arabaticum (strain ATCC 49924 / DSM 5501 / Z-7288) TaxID=574087 RepID=D9QVX6_ACEAZ|nr:stage II sporulation protein R [Acetohalobium arabaticum]ADL12385.1 stage II sporulation protein R [Acetohalobium arabaticum DSM 5501]
MKKIRLMAITVIALVILVGFGTSSAVVFTPEQDTTAYKHKNLLRLHVIANSNSVNDQKIKRKVRNRIMNQTKKLFIGVTDADKAQEVVKENLGYIESVAEAELASLDSNCQVKVKLGNFHFPKRTYGSKTLPAGDYNALRIIIGQGQGQNWWCVLFPPFCYIDSVNKKEAKKNFEALEKEEVNIKVKSKFMEYVKSNPQLTQKKKEITNLLRTSVTDLDNLISNLTSD